MDLLLVFVSIKLFLRVHSDLPQAGLFSAVHTTFVAQTSQALSNNFAAVSTSLLLEIAILQRAQINGTSTDDIPISDMTFGPSGFDIWVNALWFTSLALSLGTALMAVLVKQWLYQYMSMTSGTPRDSTLIRQYRFNGLRKWHVLTIISILPIILHIALGIFLIGLVVSLIPLNIPLACVVEFMTALCCVHYHKHNLNADFGYSVRFACHSLMSSTLESDKCGDWFIRLERCRFEQVGRAMDHRLPLLRRRSIPCQRRRIFVPSVLSMHMFHKDFGPILQATDNKQNL